MKASRRIQHEDVPKVFFIFTIGLNDDPDARSIRSSSNNNNNAEMLDHGHGARLRVLSLPHTPYR